MCYKVGNNTKVKTLEFHSFTLTNKELITKFKDFWGTRYIHFTNGFVDLFSRHVIKLNVKKLNRFGSLFGGSWKRIETVLISLYCLIICPFQNGVIVCTTSLPQTLGGFALFIIIMDRYWVPWNPNQLSMNNILMYQMHKV